MGTWSSYLQSTNRLLAQALVVVVVVLVVQVDSKVGPHLQCSQRASSMDNKRNLGALMDRSIHLGNTNFLRIHLGNPDI